MDSGSLSLFRRNSSALDVMKTLGPKPWSSQRVHKDEQESRNRHYMCPYCEQNTGTLQLAVVHAAFDGNASCVCVAASDFYFGLWRRQ